MKYEVLDDIAYEAGRDDAGHLEVKQATVGDVVELTDKDAKALLTRGAVRPAAEPEQVSVEIVPPKQLKE